MYFILDFTFLYIPTNQAIRGTRRARFQTHLLTSYTHLLASPYAFIAIPNAFIAITYVLNVLHMYVCICTYVLNDVGDEHVLRLHPIHMTASYVCVCVTSTDAYAKKCTSTSYKHTHTHIHALAIRYAACEGVISDGFYQP